MNRNTLNYLVDVSLLISFLLSLTTGLIKFPGLLQALGIRHKTIPFYEITLIHDWNGILLILLVTAHILLHRRWWTATTKKILGGRR